MTHGLAHDTIKMVIRLPLISEVHQLGNKKKKLVLFKL